MYLFALLFLVAVVIFRIRQIRQKGPRSGFPDTGGASPVRTPSPELQEHYRLLQAEIGQVSHYYRLLSDADKVLFVKRAWIFFKQKRFEARGLDTVTFRMRALIASYAAQLTFGLPDIRLEHFKVIIIYPQAYYSTITHQTHKGETHPDGAIIFSWKDLTEGHHVPTDGVNLALHELAHALKLENIIPNSEYQFLDPQAMQRFQQLSQAEMARMRMFTNVHFLRSYGATNDQEFFAVCVENFFERPAAFREHLPELYATMTKILLQDPLKRPVRVYA
jgi:Mlc titration factor MtfA (ptsG expression regulator)